MNKVDEQLIRLHKEINRRESQKVYLVHLEEVIDKKAKEVEKLAQVLAKEESDVINYESLNLYSIFARILGSYEKQLEIERQEYLHALMLYKGVEENYAALVKERHVLMKSLNSLAAIEREFDKLVIKKDNLLKETPSYPKELNILNERISSFEKQIHEINMAIKRGTASKQNLHRIIFDLNELKNWGFQGRSLMSSSVMRKTKAVKKQIYKSNQSLQRYEDQLYAISSNFKINLKHQIQNLDAFLDRFVDDLITDWVVNNKIQNSAHLVTSMMDTITMINASLEYEKGKIQKFLEEDVDLKGQLILDLINKNKS